MIRVLGIVLAPGTVNNILVYPTVLTPHHIILQFHVCQIQSFLKAVHCLYQTHFPFQLLKQTYGFKLHLNAIIFQIILHLCIHLVFIVSGLQPMTHQHQGFSGEWS